MAKIKDNKLQKVSKSSKERKPIAAAAKSFDPHLTELFESSIGPAQVVKESPQDIQTKRAKKDNATRHSQDAKADSVSQASSSSGSVSGSESISEPPSGSELAASEEVDVKPALAEQGRKRKRKALEDDLEERYLKRLASEQTVNVPAAKKQPHSQINSDSFPESQGTQTDDEHASANEQDDDEDEEGFGVPQHESLTKAQDEDEVEKASRTVFLGNVSTAAIKSKASRRVLLEHLASFFPELPTDQEYKVVSLRFRSTAFADTSLPKKAAFARKELLEATTHSTNAYAVYNTLLAAREAVKRLNATIVLDRHLRVDGVAHPSKTDHRRCIFVGNLGFVDDESNIKAVEVEEGRSNSQKKSKPPADAEEGLWRQFENAGAVESVRVVRDKATRVGKGFAYVQFEDPNSVEKALLFNDKKYPPLLPRKLRVTRAKKVTKTASGLPKERPARAATQKGTYSAKPSSQAQSLAGHAGKLFGRAGAQKFLRQANGGGLAPSRGSRGSLKAPENIIFEGHRARQGDKPSNFNKSKNGKRTKRSVAYRSRMRKG